MFVKFLTHLRPAKYQKGRFHVHQARRLHLNCGRREQKPNHALISAAGIPARSEAGHLNANWMATLGYVDTMTTTLAVRRSTRVDYDTPDRQSLAQKVRLA